MDPKKLKNKIIRNQSNFLFGFLNRDLVMSKIDQAHKAKPKIARVIIIGISITCVFLGIDG